MRATTIKVKTLLLQIVKTRVIALQVREGANARDQIVFFAFHSSLMEVQTNADYIHTTHA